jgi:hypothetical protein
VKSKANPKPGNHKGHRGIPDRVIGSSGDRVIGGSGNRWDWEN